MKTKSYLAVLMILSFLVISVADNVFYNKIATDDTTIRQNYEAKQEKYEFLKEIARDAIEEGNGIEINQFSREGIQYNIYNEGENIIVHYYIDEKIGDEYPYKATITLSNDYEILEEKYVEKEEFEDYKQGIQLAEKWLSLAYAIMALLVMYIVYFIFYFAYHATKWAISPVKKQKSKRSN